jgi:hypothetical protein
MMMITEAQFTYPLSTLFSPRSLFDSHFGSPRNLPYAESTLHLSEDDDKR